MDREQFLEQVGLLRAAGKSIRAIALELAVHRSSVEQALKNLRRAQADEPSPSLDHTRPQHWVGKETFIGRQREMASLKAALEDAVSGQGRVVMLAGEPGIGKTRTARELAAHAETRGTQVLWGWCYEEAGAPPYWPWIQPLRSYVQRQDHDRLRSQMGPGAADISEIIPEVREKLPDLQPPPALEPEQARFRLFDSITTFLMNAAHAQPLMLVLDDLHWADHPSLLLLQFLARQLVGTRIFVLGCYRDVEVSFQHPLSDTMAQLSKEPVFQRLVLQGVGEEDTSRFIEQEAGMIPPPEVVETIHALTEGNPFFLIEVVKLLSERGELRNEDIGKPQGVKVPAGVREAVGQRLNRRSAFCNRMLTVASVIGREFTLELIARLLDNISEDSLLDALDEALAAGMIEALPESAGRYQFTHALIQNALASELSAARRARLHARVGEVLEELYGANAEANASMLAYHFAEALPVIGPEKLVRYSLLAGERALATYAWEEAMEHFQRGLEAKGIVRESRGSERALDEESAAIFHSLGLAQVALNLSDQAVSSLHRSFDFYAEASDIAKAVEIAEYSHSLHLIYGMRDVMRRALELVVPDSHEAGRVLANYGFALGESEGGYSSALEMFDRALVISWRENDEVLEVRTLANAGNVHGFYLRWRECQETTARAIKLTSNIDDPRDRLRALLWNSYALTELGEPEQACFRAREGLDMAERFNDRVWLPRCLRALLIPNLAKGDWPAVDQICERFQTSASLPYRTYMRYQRGKANRDYAEKDSALQSLVGSAKKIDGRMEVLILGIIAHVTGNPELLHMAESSALGFSQLVRLAGRYRPGWESCVMGCLGLVAASGNDASAAQSVYSILTTEPGHWTWLCSSDRVRGLMAQTMGNFGQSQTHFEDALAFCRKAGYLPELAWTCHDYAQVLLQRGDPGDQARAISLLEEALTISRELGMRPLMERVLALRGRVELLPAEAPAHPDGLTEREVEVLRLVAAGKSNAEIGQELFISPNTVAHHVTNILNKTSSANRTEAATYAARHGLI